MKILYGVQATGQGHISRARDMARALHQWPVEVTWLFSGRAREALFDMDLFGEYAYRRGLTFSTRAGRIRRWATLRSNSLSSFLRDARELDLADYDLVISDFEPVVSLAARQQGRRLIGIGHQYAFGPDTPTAGASWLERQIMQRFAPVDVALGLHWHPYAEHILPPILDLPDLPVESGEHLLVYLPFEDQEAVTTILQTFPQRRFIQYSATLCDEERGNVSRRRADVVGFKRQLAGCCGVICNSGFELISECLQWRKPVLTKPLDGQMEQHANALALHQLGYAATTARLDAAVLGDWLAGPQVTADIRFPDVAGALASWIAAGCHSTPASLGERLWRQQPTPIRAPGPIPATGGGQPMTA